MSQDALGQVLSPLPKECPRLITIENQRVASLPVNGRASFLARPSK
jgi:hypothetical protein